jgi:uncharacterized membrane protein
MQRILITLSNKNSKKMYNNIIFLIRAAVIAAIYVLISVAFLPISYGLLQVRVAEALTVLPAFTPASIPGLFIGCMISNIIGGNGLIDIIFGSLATLLSAICSYKMPKRYLVPLPPVIINAIVIGLILSYILNIAFIITAAWVALGQTVACYGLGYPLMVQLEKIKDKFLN